MAINEMMTSWDVGESGILVSVGGIGVVTDSLMSWYKHDEGTGTVLTDYQGLDNGAIHGANFWANTSPDGSVCGTYSPSDNWIDGLAAANYDIASGGITLVVAAYQDDIAGNEYSLVKANNYVMATSSGVLYFIYRTGGVTNHFFSTTAAPIAATTWYIITMALTFGTPTSMKIYVNLTDESGTWSTGDGTGLPTTGADLELGHWGGTNWFDGRMGDVLIYNKMLSFAEITQNFNALKNRYNL